MEVNAVSAYRCSFGVKPDKYVQSIFDDAIKAIKKNGTSEDLTLAAKYLQDIADFSTKDKSDNKLSLFLCIGKKLEHLYKITLSTQKGTQEICSFPTKNPHQKPVSTIKLIRDSLIG